MFRDYYKILNINYPSSQEEIKTAYRKQSILWHPDKNPNIDTTEIMQDINEAYAILSNPEKKVRYDAEYSIFIGYVQSKRCHDSNDDEYTNDYYEREYEFQDKTVEEDVREAKDYAKRFVSELKESLSRAGKGAWEEAQGYVWAAVVLIIMSLLLQTCI